VVAISWKTKESYVTLPLFCDRTLLSSAKMRLGVGFFFQVKTPGFGITDFPQIHRLTPDYNFCLAQFGVLNLTYCLPNGYH
jgi:hypothetical protein